MWMKQVNTMEVKQSNGIFFGTSWESEIWPNSYSMLVDDNEKMLWNKGFLSEKHEMKTVTSDLLGWIFLVSIPILLLFLNI